MLCSLIIRSSNQSAALTKIVDLDKRENSFALDCRSKIEQIFALNKLINLENTNGRFISHRLFCRSVAIFLLDQIIRTLTQFFPIRLMFRNEDFFCKEQNEGTASGWCNGKIGGLVSKRSGVHLQPPIYIPPAMDQRIF